MSLACLVWSLDIEGLTFWSILHGYTCDKREMNYKSKRKILGYWCWIVKFKLVFLYFVWDVNSRATRSTYGSWKAQHPWRNFFLCGEWRVCSYCIYVTILYFRVWLFSECDQEVFLRVSSLYFFVFPFISELLSVGTLHGRNDYIDHWTM